MRAPSPEPRPSTGKQRRSGDPDARLSRWRDDAASASGARRWLAASLIVACGLAVFSAGIGAVVLYGPAWSTALTVSVSMLATVAGTMIIGVGLYVAVGAGERRMARVLADAMEETHAGYLIADRLGHVLHANLTAQRLLGGTVVQDLAEVEAIMRDDAEALAMFRRLRREAEGGSPLSAEIVHRQAGGGSFWWQISARALSGDDGLLVWRIENVTVRREAEASLRDEQLKLVDFMDHAPVGFYSVDGDGRFLFANATLGRWLGVEPRDLVRGDYRLHDFLAQPPAGRAPHMLSDDSTRTVVEVFMRGLDGQALQASVAQTEVFDEEGRFVWTRSVVRDLTQERQMRAALRASEDRFRRFFEEAPIGIALLDEETRIAEWNEAFDALIGVDARDFAGHPFSALLDDRDRETVAGHLAGVAQGAATDPMIEVQIRDRIGMVCSLYASRMDDQRGVASGFIVQLIDQSERRKLETQFVQSQKMQAMGQLAGGVAHDFNNLLTAMIGFCDLLLNRHKPGDPSFGDIMQVKQNANRAANLVRQLLAFSRQQTLQPRVIDIADVLAELSNLLRRLIGENIELKMIHGREVGLVKVDQGQFEQVVINLAVNARDAMPRGGRLTLTTENISAGETVRVGPEEMPAGDYVQIEVIDTGVGIAADNIDRIFDPFFSTKEIGSGTGLGLSTVYGIVRQTGGFVQVDSAPGKGAKFSIFLPRHMAEVPREEPEVVEQLPRDLTGAGRILLVEDEDAVRVFSARALRNKGYEVMEADSGEVALQLLNADDAPPVDMLITDIIMPQMDGPTLIREVRILRPGIKVICISGYAEERFRDRLDDGESLHFLPKPFSLKQLAGKVKDVLTLG